MLSCVHVILTCKPLDWFSWKLVWINNINWRWYQLKGTEIPFACRGCPKKEVSRGLARIYVLRKNNALFYKKVCTLQEHFSHFWMLPGSFFDPHPASQETVFWDVLLLEDIQCNVCSQYDEAIIVTLFLSFFNVNIFLWHPSQETIWTDRRVLL